MPPYTYTSTSVLVVFLLDTRYSYCLLLVIFAFMRSDSSFEQKVFSLFYSQEARMPCSMRASGNLVYPVV